MSLEQPLLPIWLSQSVLNLEISLLTMLYRQQKGEASRSSWATLFSSSLRWIYCDSTCVIGITSVCTAIFHLCIDYSIVALFE